MYSSISEFNKTFSLKQYVAELYNITNYQYKKLITIPCPFHSETTASCAIYNNSYHCFGAGCGAHGTSYNFLLAQGFSKKDILNMDDKYISLDQAQLNTKHRTGKIPEVLVKIYNKDLLSSDEKMQYVIKRHFDEDSIRKSKIGYVYDVGKVFGNFEAPRYIIPVYDEKQKLITARYRIDPAYEPSEEPKYLGHPNCNSALYNSHIIQDSQNIVIVGSEFDAAFLYYRYGVFAIAPPGEGNFRPEWSNHFTRQHNVLIWLDYDFAGISAAIKLYESIKSVCNTKIYSWDSSFKNKQDVCDFMDRFGIEGIYGELDKYGIKAYS